MPVLVDSHCHLNFPELLGTYSLSDIIDAANQQDVQFFQTICTSLNEADEVYEIASSHASVFASVGVHPNHVHEAPIADEDHLTKLSNRKKTIGIGETGLDYFYAAKHQAMQLQSFDIHIKVAQETGLPLIVHTRDAEEDTIRHLQNAYKHKPFRGLIHCFTGSERLAEASLEIGMYISISGIVTFKNAKRLQSVIKQIPLERLLVETDSPYLAPEPMRGKSNHPAYTQFTAKYLAHLKDISYEDLASITTHNFFKLFTKAAEQLPDDRLRVICSNTDY